MNGTMLEHEAEMLFGCETTSKLKKWYSDILDERWDYVVFVVRRSYLLALILEEITGIKMQKSGTAFLTDASLLLHCEEMAEYFCTYGKFPSILLCDDILKHGRGINHVIEFLEKRLNEILSDYGYGKEEINSELSKSLYIRVFARSSERVFIKEKYALNVKYEEKLNFSALHGFSSNISTLILRANIANAVYIYSEFWPETQIDKDKLRGQGFLYTSYQNVKEYTKTELLQCENGVKAIFTLRLVKNDEGYRAIPFVFLPNLSECETQNITEAIFEKIEDDDCKDWLQLLEKIEGKRSFNELLTLLLSNVILQDFNSKNVQGEKINEQDTEKEAEILKLARNYDQDGLNKTKMKLCKLIDAKLFDMYELNDILNRNIDDEHAFIKLSDETSKELVEVEAAEDIKKRIEKYFYERGCKEEESLFKLSSMTYIPDENRSQRSVRGCCFTLKELGMGYSRKQIEYCMAFFSQLMDAGALTVSSYASSNMKVVGFSQFVKAGEQSLLLYPLSMYEYIPMLNRMQWECERWDLNLAEEIRSYCTKQTDEFQMWEVSEMLEFVETLRKYGQTPTDWMQIYFSKIDFSNCIKEDDSLEREKFRNYAESQMQHLENYRKYAENSYR